MIFGGLYPVGPMVFVTVSRHSVTVVPGHVTGTFVNLIAGTTCVPFTGVGVPVPVPTSLEPFTGSRLLFPRPPLGTTETGAGTRGRSLTSG